MSPISKVYKLVVDHEFVDIVSYQWSLHAMVLHIGATRNRSPFVAYNHFADELWLFDDRRVEQHCPIPSPCPDGDFCAVQAHAN